jgi:hypothetical protein
MGLTGAQLDQTFGSGFSPVKAIRGFNRYEFNRPSADVTDTEIDVTEQGHPASISADSTTGALTIAPAAQGEGLWIPYLGNGKGQPGSKGWGTFCSAAGTASWVATGPFSGCYVASFIGTERWFAHLITPAAGYRAASVEDQIAAIKKATGSANVTKWPMNGSGLGLAFFMNDGGSWKRRFVWVDPSGSVMQMNAKSEVI